MLVVVLYYSYNRVSTFSFLLRLVLRVKSNSRSFLPSTRKNCHQIRRYSKYELRIFLCCVCVCVCVLLYLPCLSSSKKRSTQCVWLCAAFLPLRSNCSDVDVNNRIHMRQSRIWQSLTSSQFTSSFIISQTSHLLLCFNSV